MKNQLGLISKIFCITLLSINLLSQCAYSYQTALITYPEYNKKWKQVYIGRQNDEVISQWVPYYSDRNNWNESVVFHAYNWAKGASSYKFMFNLLNNVSAKNNTMQSKIIKDDNKDAIAMWCVNKNSVMNAQCEILRVTSAYEGTISIHYINKNKQNFIAQQKEWLDIIKNVRIYYSYYRWDRVMGKETSVNLQ